MVSRREGPAPSREFRWYEPQRGRVLSSAHASALWKCFYLLCLDVTDHPELL